MPESTPTVFLSYASDDRQAAQKICDALRAAGMEVWFDLSELRGGDACCSFPPPGCGERAAVRGTTAAVETVKISFQYLTFIQLSKIRNGTYRSEFSHKTPMYSSQ